MLIYKCIGRGKSPDWECSQTATVHDPTLRKRKRIKWTHLNSDLSSWRGLFRSFWGAQRPWKLAQSKFRTGIMAVCSLYCHCSSKLIFSNLTLGIDASVLLLFALGHVCSFQNKKGWNHKGKLAFPRLSAMQANKRALKLKNDWKKRKNSWTDLGARCCQYLLAFVNYRWLAIKYFNVLLTEMIKRRDTIK